jgi:hypothetical protein
LVVGGLKYHQVLAHDISAEFTIQAGEIRYLYFDLDSKRTANALAVDVLCMSGDIWASLGDEHMPFPSRRPTKDADPKKSYNLKQKFIDNDQNQLQLGRAKFELKKPADKSLDRRYYVGLEAKTTGYCQVNHHIDYEAPKTPEQETPQTKNEQKEKEKLPDVPNKIRLREDKEILYKLSPKEMKGTSYIPFYFDLNMEGAKAKDALVTIDVTALTGNFRTCVRYPGDTLEKDEECVNNSGMVLNPEDPKFKPKGTYLIKVIPIAWEKTLITTDKKAQQELDGGLSFSVVWFISKESQKRPHALLAGLTKETAMSGHHRSYFYHEIVPDFKTGSVSEGAYVVVQR